MRRTPLRLFGFAVPLACIVLILCGKNDPSLFCQEYLLVLALSLNAPDAFSRCAAKQMSTKKVMGSLLGAIVLSLLFTVGGNIYSSAAGINSPDFIFESAALALLVILRCFEELFASQNDTASATITTVLTALALTASVMLSDASFAAMLGGVGCITLISGSIALGFSRHEWPRMNFAIFREIPAAMGRLLLFPAFLVGIQWLHDGSYGSLKAEFIAAMAGLILLEVFKSTFRRSREESAGIKVGVALSTLFGTAGILLLGCFSWTRSFPKCQAILMAAGAAALLLYASFDWETIAATAILLGAAAVTVIGITPGYLPFPKEVFIGPAAGAALCGLMLRQWGQLLRQARANQIRKRAMKKSRS